MPPVLPKRTDPLPDGCRAVVDIRGTHGSGKTTVVRNLLKMGEWEPLVGPVTANGKSKHKHLGFANRAWGAAVIGNYPEGFASGGCDGVSPPDEVCRRVRMFASEYRVVILEGILVSHTFQRYNDLAVELEGGGLLAGDDIQYRFYFLDTPLETCLARVKARNEASRAANIRPFNEKHVRGDYGGIWERTRAKCVAAGRRVYVLDHRDPVRRLVADLRLGEG